MEELSKLEDDRRKGRLPGKARKKGIASNEMCTLPEPVWERESGGNRRGRHCGDGGEYVGGGGVLQGDG